ncbi:unnamed protein product, partial [Symbiodinium sp. CCMP2456]
MASKRRIVKREPQGLVAEVPLHRKNASESLTCSEEPTAPDNQNVKVKIEDEDAEDSMSAAVETCGSIKEEEDEHDSQQDEQVSQDGDNSGSENGNDTGPEESGSEETASQEGGLDVRFIEPIVFDIPDSDSRCLPHQSFVEGGHEQFQQWMKHSLAALDTATQSDLAELLSTSAPIHVGTACSGSDAPVLVLKSFLAAVQQQYGVSVQLQHIFSCEHDDSKQAFLERMYTRTPDRVDMQHLFDSTQQLRRGPGKEALDVLTKQPETIPSCSDLYFGFPCQDISKLNNASRQASNRTAVKDGAHRTGSVFKDIMRYVEKLVVAAECEDTVPLQAMIMENVLGLLDRPRGVDVDTGLKYHNNMEYVDLAVRKVGFCMIPLQVDPRMFGMPVARPRLFLLCLPLQKLVDAGVSEDQLRAMATQHMQKLLVSQMRDLDDFLLNDADPLIQEDYAKAVDLAERRQQKLESDLGTAKRAPKRKAETEDAAVPKAKIAKCKWAETHTKAMELMGKDWWESYAPSPATLKKFPGLHALTDRQLDLCQVFGIGFPDSRKAIVDLSQGLRSASYVKRIMHNRCDVVTPHGQQLITHRARCVSGLEALHLQGLHWGVDHDRLSDIRSDLLRSLAGNAMNTYCFGACLIVQKALEANLHVMQLAKQKSQQKPIETSSHARPTRSSTLDDLFNFEAHVNLLCDAPVCCRHQLCLVCVGVFKKKDPELVINPDKRSKYLKELQDNDEVYESHKRDLDTYEASRIDSYAKRRKTGKPLPENPELEDEDLDTKVKTAQEQALEIRTCLGASADDSVAFTCVLWPVEMVEQVQGRKVKPSEITKIQQGGETLSGILMPKSKGVPDGATEVYDIKKSGACKVKTAASSESALFQNELSNSWAAAQAAHSFSASTHEVDGQPLVQLKGQKRAKADEFDDLMDFDVSVSGGPDPEPAPKGGNRGRRSNGKAKAQPKPPGPSNTNKLAKGDGKATKEIQTSERIVLEASQVLENLQTDDTLMTLKQKALGTLKDRVAARLTSALITLYSTGYDMTDSTCTTPGMQILEKLRECQQKLELLSPVVEKLHDDKCSGQELHKAVHDAQSQTACLAKPFSVCSRLQEICVQKEVDRCAKEGDFNTVITLLFSTKADGSEFGAHIIEDDNRRKLYCEREIMRLIAEMLRQEGRVQEVRSFVKAVIESKLLENTCPILAELMLLWPLLNPMDLSVREQDIQDSASKFRSEKTLKLSKMMCNFPSGMAILQEAATALEQRARDNQMGSQLRKAQVRSTGLSVPALDAPHDHFLQQLEGFKLLVEELSDVRANTSAQFLSLHNDHIQAISSQIKEFEAQAAAKARNMTVATATSCLQGVPGPEKAAKLSEKISEIVAKCESAAENIIETEITCLGEIRTDEATGAIRSEVEQLVNALNVLRTTLPLVAQESIPQFDISNDNIVALGDLLQNPPALLRKLEVFDSFQAAMKTTVWSMIERLLDVSFAPLLSSAVFRGMLCAATATLAGTSAQALDLSAEKLEIDAKSEELGQQMQKALQSVIMLGGDFAIALPESPEMQDEVATGDASDAVGPCRNVRAPLWLLCLFPSMCSLVARAKTLSSKADAAFQPGAELVPDNCAGVADNLLEVRSGVDQLRASIQSVEIPETAVSLGQRLHLTNFSCGAVQKHMEAVEIKAAKCMEKFIQTTEHHAGALLEQQNIASVTSILDKGCDQTSLNLLLPISQSDESKQLHKCVKSLDKTQELLQIVGRMKQPNDQIYVSLALNNDLRAKAKSMNATLACVQAMARPLKTGEERPALARRARLMIKAKQESEPDVKIAADLDLLLSKTAASA